jgi:hypothetical protein
VVSGGLAGGSCQGKRGEAVDPVRSEASSVARARSSLRRWCAQHRAFRLVTLTFAQEPSDLDEGWLLIEGFRRRLREAGIEQPAIVPQWGSRVGRLHFHAAFREFVPKSTLVNLWGHGFVDIRVLHTRTSKRTSVPHRELARRAAGYLAAYVSERSSADSDDSGGSAATSARTVGANRKRYSIPKGEPVKVVRFSCLGGLFEAWSEAQRLCGHTLLEVWRSPPDDPGWRAPPTLLLMG